MKAQSRYSIKLSDHRAWIGKAKDLIGAASLLEPAVAEIIKRWRIALDFEPASGPPSEVREGVLDVYLMLTGYAAECFLKGRFTRKLLRGKKGHRFETNKLPDELRNHNIRRLCEKLDIGLSDREGRLVAILEDSVVWTGRYPVPTAAEKLRPRMISDEQVGSFKDLLSKFEQCRSTRRTRPSGVRAKRRNPR